MTAYTHRVVGEWVIHPHPLSYRSTEEFCRPTEACQTPQRKAAWKRY